MACRMLLMGGFEDKDNVEGCLYYGGRATEWEGKDGREADSIFMALRGG